jgi:hypothetical protein
MTPEEQRAWLEEVRPQLELIVLTCTLGGLNGVGKGNAQIALQLTKNLDDPNYTHLIPRAHYYAQRSLELWSQYLAGRTSC